MSMHRQQSTYILMWILSVILVLQIMLPG